MGTFFLIGLREFRMLMITRIKTSGISNKARWEYENIHAMFENIPMAIEQLRKMEMDLIVKKATDDQLKTVRDRIKMLETVNTWRFVLEPAAAYVGPLVKVVTKWLR